MAKKKIEAQGIPENPDVKVDSSAKGKVYCWVAANDQPACVAVYPTDGSEVRINLKSLFKALEANGYAVTKK